MYAGFDESVGDALCDALFLHVSTLKEINLNGHASWFDTDRKCIDWAKVFASQRQLENLELE